MYAKLLTLKYKLSRTDHGASMVEYSLLVVFIALVAFLAVRVAGTELSTTYTDIATSVANG